MVKYKKYFLSNRVWIAFLLMACFGLAFADRAQAQFPLFQDSPTVSAPAQTGLSANPPAKEGQNAAEEEEPADVEEEQDLMENALDILEVADNYWKNGDIENTSTNWIKPTRSFWTRTATWKLPGRKMICAF